MAEIIHTARMPWGENLAAQRSGGMAHKLLFEGEEGSPDNYMLVLADEKDDYFSPRHRHPWDQVRYCLTGTVPIGKGLGVAAGEAAYFPEGAHYGPQEGGGDRIELLLQFGGASKLGYFGAERLKAARIEMQAFGRFEKGVFSRTDGEGRTNQDAYEAIWQHITGEPLAYPDPAYKTPVVMRPEALAWSDTGETGVRRKLAGVFPHRGLTVALYDIAAGSTATLCDDGRLDFLYLLQGSGAIGPDRYEKESVVRSDWRATEILHAETDTRCLAIGVARVLRAP
ncbi:cupin domain-containing protein [Parasphingopyxis marina]|uniref:Cupin domain-containing protein n=1 Tax=Parasphingopyxis marina TaxID=2761622 RepID=A0A842I059_9SPHN|nr:hypothetical protein [Parasphingopyxis marina]MBC2778063.1 hypothetical protein [Parasphingopyxis marina]